MIIWKTGRHKEDTLPSSEKNAQLRGVQPNGRQKATPIEKFEKPFTGLPVFRLPFGAVARIASGFQRVAEKEDAGDTVFQMGKAR